MQRYGFFLDYEEKKARCAAAHTPAPGGAATRAKRITNRLLIKNTVKSFAIIRK